MNAATSELVSNNDVVCLLFVLHYKVWRRGICTRFGLLVMIVTVWQTILLRTQIPELTLHKVVLQSV